MRKWIGGCWMTLGNQSSRRKERGRSRLEVSRVLESASCSASLPSAHSQPLGSSGYFEVLSFFILFLSTHSNTVDHTKNAGQGLKFYFQGNYSLFSTQPVYILGVLSSSPSGLSIEQHNFFEKLVRLQPLTSLLQAYRIRIHYGEHPLEICVHICP